MDAFTSSLTLSLAGTENVRNSRSEVSFDLPAEIEREIFEVTARNFPGTSVKLAGLSKKTQYWMDWYIYETVVLDHPTIRAAFLRTIDARPAEFFSQRIKKLYLSYTVTMPEAQKILLVCTGLTQLTCWAQNSLQTQGWLLPHLNPHSNSHLTRLSIKLDMLTRENSLPSFSDAIYQNLTHLDIVLPPSVNLGACIDWRALLDLPYLRHLIIGDLNAWGHLYLLPVLRDLLSSSVRLETLAVLTKEHQMLEALEVENFDDPRLVILPRFNWPENLPTYWKKLHTGELDAWEPSAEKARKQQLEWDEKRRESLSASASELDLRG